MTMHVGYRVRWTSQAGGYAKVKEGVVRYIIPAKRQPEFIMSIKDVEAALKLYWGFPRNHESYVIDVNGRLYWPRVKGMEVVNADESR